MSLSTLSYVTSIQTKWQHHTIRFCFIC
uniref:Uncharacterized protein n=1 Tax=Rhizophora mucronata TaxID=61149 RepID=A0A2P2QYA6_RHIMU